MIYIVYDDSVLYSTGIWKKVQAQYRVFKKQFGTAYYTLYSGQMMCLYMEDKLLEDLLWNYAQRTDKDKNFCYRYLIQLQDNRGLKAYREILEKNRKIEKNYIEDELLRSIGNIRKEELWEELFKLVEL